MRHPALFPLLAHPVAVDPVLSDVKAALRGPGAGPQGRTGVARALTRPQALPTAWRTPDPLGAGVLPSGERPPFSSCCGEPTTDEKGGSWA